MKADRQKASDLRDETRVDLSQVYYFEGHDRLPAE